MQASSPTPQEFLKSGLGYGLSRRSQERYAQMQEEKRRDDAVVLKVHQLIEWAYTSYEAAKSKNYKNLRVYTELTLDWNPERVLSTYKHFEKLCQYVSKDRMWRRLNRTERRFLTDAYQYFLSASPS